MTADTMEHMLPDQFRGLAAPGRKVTFVSRAQIDGPQQLLLVHGGDGLSCQSKSRKARLINDKSVVQYMPTTLERRAGAGRPPAFQDVRVRISEMLDESWESGKNIIHDNVVCS